MEHIGSSSNAPQNHSSDSDDANNAKFTEVEIAWYKMRSEWVGDRSKRLQKQPREPIKRVENYTKVCPSQTHDSSDRINSREKEMFARTKDEAGCIEKISATKRALQRQSALHNKDAADIEASGWRSTENRQKMVTEMVEDCIRDRPYLSEDIHGLTKSMEISEAEVFASSKDEVEYMEGISIKKMQIQPDDERNYFLYPPEDHYHY